MYAAPQLADWGKQQRFALGDKLRLWPCRHLNQRRKATGLLRSSVKLEYAVNIAWSVELVPQRFLSLAG